MPLSVSDDRSSSRFALVALCLALMGSASIVYYHLGLFVPRVLAVRASKGLGNGYAFGGDFFPIWLVVRQWRLDRLDPYSPQTTLEIQTGLFGRPLDPHNPTDPSVDYRQFAYPAFTELLLWPSASLEFSKLRIVLAVVLPLLTVASLWLWMLALQWRVHPLWFGVLALLSLCNYQILEAVFAAQPGLIVGFLLASAALALKRSRLLLAGMLMALTLIKPQMTLLAVVYLLLWSLYNRARLRFLAAFLGTTLCLITASLWIWPLWVGQWMKVLLGYHRYATPPLVVLLPGASLGAFFGTLAVATLLGVSGLLAWRNREASIESLDFWLTLSLLLVFTSVTLVPGQAIYDDVILFPGIFLILRYRSQLYHAGMVPRILLSIGAVVLAWPWLAAFALIVLRPWLAAEVFESTAVFSLPIRTAASLPFAVLALLGYTRRINLQIREPA
jgi:hypothetical protein